MPSQILDFWFNEISPKQWWAKDNQFDQLINERFGDLLQQASRGELYRWRSDAKGRLAEIIVLDQFSRNIHRDTPAAFAQDAMALVLAQEAVAGGALAQLTADERSFLLLPYMHSESPHIHQLAELLYKHHAPDNNYQFELKHKAIIDRFGRYPHRNAILGRESTAEELEFLKQPGSGF
ncbi:DUF924 family protein [Arsukibacterium sp.]|uniref:DUF924 family protein n=1 Tax=Arsukibacterium sp. TaxID=1977258 RepID=UPI00356A5F48